MCYEYSIFFKVYYHTLILDLPSVINTDNCYELKVLGLKPLCGQTFFGPMQASPRAHQASCTVGNWTSYLGVKWRGLAMPNH